MILENIVSKGKPIFIINGVLSANIKNFKFLNNSIKSN